ncbi:MAG TPA: ornithine cyclodeaminase family protein [Xanthobacteraceae bacterium]
MTIREKRTVPIYLTERDVAEFLDMPSAIKALREAFLARRRGEATVVPRTRWEFGGRRLNVMGGGITPQGRYVLKAYGSSAYHVLLYSAEGLLAVIEADYLGVIRTGAATAVATEAMARPNGRRVALIGAGRQAHGQALALKAIDRLEEIAVFARHRDKLETFCETIEKELGRPVRAAASGEEAAFDADIVVTATTSPTPVLMHGWLKAGVHINAMGANAASRREIDSQIVRFAGLLVTDDIAQARIEAAEFIDLASAGQLDWERVRPLHEIIGSSGFVRDAGSITLFKSLGIGLEDVAVASAIYDRALATGRFKPL